MVAASKSPTGSLPGFLGRLSANTSGNVMAMMAASLFPLIALVGGGIDMGRGYLVQSRLQQACDAGTLAARKRLGASVAVDNTVPDDIAATGQRFFNLNFRDGAYGSKDRDFVMTLEADYSISGSASVNVPTTLMAIFGYETLPVDVTCASILNFSNLDVMMVLDTTGSMRHTNVGDSLSRMDSLKQTIRGFHTLVETSKAPGTEIRYGFVPYATNVNVGHLLKDSWVVESWDYQSRKDARIVEVEEGTVTRRNWRYISGQRTDWNKRAVESTYDATFHPGRADTGGSYTCDRATPKGDFRFTAKELGESRKEIQKDPPAILNIQSMESIENGRRYWTVLKGNQCEVQFVDAVDYVQTFDEVTAVPQLSYGWRYDRLNRDVSAWRTTLPGCIEERSTYEIADYGNVDFSRALDLDIDLVPTAGAPDTQWRPWDNNDIFLRRILAGDFTGTVKTAPSMTTEEYYNAGDDWYSVCPPKAQKLQEMNSTQLGSYLGTLQPEGATYHDIGMIWGGRLLSPTGLFASENADVAGKERSRHMIWLTDGQTEPFPWAYGAYGLEVLDKRRWDPEKSSQNMTQVIEKRFKVACEQVRNRNITVWVIAFGTGLTDVMTHCAGTDRAFQAANAEELNEAFAAIAKSMSELRVSN